MEQYIYIIGWLVLMLAFFYFFLIRPQKKKEKEKTAMLASLSKRDEVMTTEGIYGRVVRINENAVTISTGPDDARIKIDKSAIDRIIKKA